MKRFSLAVLQTHPTQFDGPLFREIARTGAIDLTVYYLDTDQVSLQVDPELGFSPNWDIPVVSGYRLVRCPQGLSQRLRFLRRECFSANKYELVIVPGWGRPELDLLALLFRRQPLGVRLDTAMIYPELRAKAHLKRALLKRLFRRYSVFHPVGSLSEAFLRTVGMGQDRIFRFPYAVDNEYFRATSGAFRKRRDGLLQDQGISPQHFVVLGVLKFIPRENPMELLRGFHSFHRRFPDSALILVGAGPLEKDLRSYVSTSGLSKIVRLVGYARYGELPKWYGISNVFVHPSANECWGVSVNEAMACGLPVVASSLVGSSYDLIKEGVNGYQYPSEDAQALADCLARIASRPDRGWQLGESSARLIQAWDFRATIRSLESALRSVRSDCAHRISSSVALLEPARAERGQHH
jgi:glycosyltransferase involved in cell wall biosynthesis